MTGRSGYRHRCDDAWPLAVSEVQAGVGTSGPVRESQPEEKSAGGDRQSERLG